MLVKIFDTWIEYNSVIVSIQDNSVYMEETKSHPRWLCTTIKIANGVGGFYEVEIKRKTKDEVAEEINKAKGAPLNYFINQSGEK